MFAISATRGDVPGPDQCDGHFRRQRRFVLSRDSFRGREQIQVEGKAALNSSRRWQRTMEAVSSSEIKDLAGCTATDVTTDTHVDLHLAVEVSVLEPPAMGGRR